MYLLKNLFTRCTLNFHKCTYILCDMHNTLQNTTYKRAHTVSLGGGALKRHFLQRDIQYDCKM